MVVVQPFNADGTTPAACNPTIPCKGDTNTCPPPDEPVCTLQHVQTLATLNPFFGTYRKQWTTSPGLAAAWNGRTLKTKRFNLNTTSDFKPEVYFPDSYLGLGNNADTGQGFIDMLDNSPGLVPMNVHYNKAQARLYRVLGDLIAAWDIGGQCMVVTSPVVLDLIYKGTIETSGVSSARYVIPRHRVNATVEFDMGGTGKNCSQRMDHRQWPGTAGGQPRRQGSDRHERYTPIRQHGRLCSWL